MVMTPEFVVLTVAEFVIAAALTVTGPAIDIVPAANVTAELLPVLPIRKLDGAPLNERFVVAKVCEKFAEEDSYTTGPVVLAAMVGEPDIESAITVIAPLGAVDAAAAPSV